MKSSNKWLARIFRWEVAGVVIAAVSLIYAYKSFKIDEGGELQITTPYAIFDSEDTIAVVTDDNDLASVLNQLLPEFRNSIKYSLKNFNLTYDITTSEPTDFIFSPDFTTRQVSPTRISATLADHTLYAHSQVEAPFLTVTPSKSNFNMAITVRATFDGAAEPYNTTCNYHFYPTSALNTLKENYDRYAYVLETKNNRLTEVNLIQNTTSSPEPTTAVRNQDIAPSQPASAPSVRNNNPVSATTTIESEDSSDSIWNRNILGIPVLGLLIGLLLCLIYLPALSSPENTADDIFVWPWNFSNVKNRVKNRLYRNKRCNLRQRLWVDMVIISTLLSVIVTVALVIWAIGYLIYLGYTSN